jgi:C1A family cysteine protease
LIEHDVGEDAGALKSDGVKCLETYGICAESMWPYVTSRFAVAPPQICYAAAAKHKALVVHSIQNDLLHMKTALASGFPFAVGIQVYQSFESERAAATGMIPMPNPESEELLGGHAVCIVGYTDPEQCWIARNSWGADWGDKGYFFLPFEYLTDPNLSSDLWSVTSVK